MSGVGTGYDLSCTSYSPDGKVFQIEYAGKAVDNSGTAVGVRVKDGIVLGVEKLVISKMLEPGSNRRITSIDRHIGTCFAGLSADARALVNRARSEAKNYRNFYQDPIPARVLTDRVSGFVQAYTLYGHVRPFGVSTIIGAWDADGPQLFMIEPSGLSYGYYGTAVGKGRQAAKGELEKLKLSEMTVVQATKEVAKIIYSVHDDVKDKEFELELSWISEATGFHHQFVPKDVQSEAERYAKAALEEAMEDQ
eukprot:TRINITY_DN1773_c0_g1_i1.p1 TRINITY_DN1773_c0_g1~~TRINITY_DN1773_c0_g1_i1.p1  ORF type:complete len:251 (-),score=43.90 TRINITY_DN1773_c0_g1_i1:50-802(-)